MSYWQYQSERRHRLRRVGLASLLTDVNGRVAVDLGAGNGYLLGLLADFPVVLAVDLTPLASEEASAVAADADWLPLASASVDVMLMGELLEHMVTPLCTLQEVYRVLRPGGWLVGSVPNSGQFWDVLAMISGDAPHQIRQKNLAPAYEHQSFFTIRSLRAVLGAAGFCEILVRTNLVRLWPSWDGEIPGVSQFLVAWAPRFGDRLLWRCRKGVKDAGQR